MSPELFQANSPPGRLSAFLCKRFLSLRLLTNLHLQPLIFPINDDFSYCTWASKLTRPNVRSIQIHRFDQRSKTWSSEGKTNEVGTAPKIKGCWTKHLKQTKKNRNRQTSIIFENISQIQYPNEMDELPILSALKTFEALTQCRTVHQHPTTLFPEGFLAGSRIDLPQHLRSYHLTCLRTIWSGPCNQPQTCFKSYIDNMTNGYQGIVNVTSPFIIIYHSQVRAFRASDRYLLRKSTCPPCWCETLVSVGNIIRLTTWYDQYLMYLIKKKHNSTNKFIK